MDTAISIQEGETTTSLNKLKKHTKNLKLLFKRKVEIHPVIGLQLGLLSSLSSQIVWNTQIPILTKLLTVASVMLISVLTLAYSPSTKQTEETDTS